MPSASLGDVSHGGMMGGMMGGDQGGYGNRGGDRGALAAQEALRMRQILQKAKDLERSQREWRKREKALVGELEVMKKKEREASEAASAASAEAEEMAMRAGLVGAIGFGDTTLASSSQRVEAKGGATGGAGVKAKGQDEGAAEVKTKTAERVSGTAGAVQAGAQRVEQAEEMRAIWGSSATQNGGTSTMGVNEGSTYTAHSNGVGDGVGDGVGNGVGNGDVSHVRETSISGAMEGEWELNLDYPSNNSAYTNGTMDGMEGGEGFGANEQLSMSEGGVYMGDSGLTGMTGDGSNGGRREDEWSASHLDAGRFGGGGGGRGGAGGGENKGGGRKE